jgi:hypothetical protein
MDSAGVDMTNGKWWVECGQWKVLGWVWPMKSAGLGVANGRYWVRCDQWEVIG